MLGKTLCHLLPAPSARVNRNVEANWDGEGWIPEGSRPAVEVSWDPRKYSVMLPRDWEKEEISWSVPGAEQVLLPSGNFCSSVGERKKWKRPQSPL